MTDEQIREWVVELQNAIVTGEADQHTLESAARALIASVRAEAIEECAKVCDKENADAREKYNAAVHDENATSGAICASVGMAATRIATAIRALVKERKGDD